MKSRSDWLKYTKHFQQYPHSTRKHFEAHKKDHKIVFYQGPEESINSNLSLVRYSNNNPEIENMQKSPKSQQINEKPLRKLGPIKTSLTPERKILTNDSISPSLDQNFYYKQLKEKDKELKILKNLYDDTSKKLQQYEKKIITSNRMKIETDIQQNSFGRNKSLVDYTNKIRTPDLKKANFLDLHAHPAFSQPKYTKSNPKIILSNPITGISPDF